MGAGQSADALFKALGQAGIPRSYVQRMLPHWWTEDLYGNPNALAELNIHLARMFGLKVGDLVQDEPKISFETGGRPKYKRARRIDEHDLEGATALIHAVAVMVATAMPNPFEGFPSDPLEIRAKILRHARHVSLRALIEFLWQKGIPTIHVAEMPPAFKKMDGLALRIGGRPVIMLGKQTPLRAWHLFIAAHEAGHCAMEHVASDEILVDVNLGENSYLLGDEDVEEQAADRFAIALLNGEYDVQYTSAAKCTAPQLANAALERQKSHQVDAGHVILNYGHKNNAWRVAQTALRLIDKEDARLAMNHELMSQLDLSRLPTPSVEYLTKVLGLLPEGAQA